MKFLVVFPIVRGIDALNASLGGVLLQTGDLDLHVHVQSADFSGDTHAIVDKWQRWLSDNNQSGKKQLSIRYEQDSGLYDGIARGVDAVSPENDWIMTWLGADDVLLPNSLATVQSILTQRPLIKWLTGQSFASGPDGANCSPHPWINYRREDLANGKHDGRSAPFVMQEGTFWTAGLWRKVGGVNRNLKWAGDWDLWRRFAEFEPLYALDFPLGKFSQTVGRLSEDISHYHREVDEISPTLSAFMCDDRNAYKVWRHIGQTDWNLTVIPEHRRFLISRMCARFRR